METINQKRSITPEKIVALLSKYGVEISSADAETVINFLYFLAEIVIDENTGNEGS